jgi:hypothetical protein
MAQPLLPRPPLARRPQGGRAESCAPGPRGVGRVRGNAAVEAGYADLQPHLAEMWGRA